MKGAAEFCLDWLVQDGKGHLVTAPSIVARDKFRAPDGTRPRRRPSTMSTWRSSGISSPTWIDAVEPDVDALFSRQIRGALARLPPYRIGSQGQLLEWFEEFGDPEPHHRHFSHLFGLHPGRQHHARGDARSSSRPCAARTSCAATAAPAGGLAWKVNQLGALRDGDRAQVIGYLLRLVDTSAPTTPGRRRLREPLRRPPALPDRRQLRRHGGDRRDVVQSHPRRRTDARRSFHLLPAVPSAWPAGPVTGLARPRRLSRSTSSGRAGS